MKGRADCARVDRMRPGRTRNSWSSAMTRGRNVRKIALIQAIGRQAHIADEHGNVRSAPKYPAKTTARPPRNVRPFILPSCGCCACLSPLCPPCHAGMRQSAKDTSAAHRGVPRSERATTIGAFESSEASGVRTATEERLSFDRALSDGDVAERSSAERTTKSGASRQSGGGGGATDGALAGDVAPSCGASSAI